MAHDLSLSYTPTLQKGHLKTCRWVALVKRWVFVCTEWHQLPRRSFAVVAARGRWTRFGEGRFPHVCRSPNCPIRWWSQEASWVGWFCCTKKEILYDAGFVKHQFSVVVTKQKLPILGYLTQNLEFFLLSDPPSCHRRWELQTGFPGAGQLCTHLSTSPLSSNPHRVQVPLDTLSIFRGSIGLIMAWKRTIIYSNIWSCMLLIIPHYMIIKHQNCIEQYLLYIYTDD